MWERNGLKCQDPDSLIAKVKNNKFSISGLILFISTQAGVSNMWPAGHIQPRMAMNSA